MKDGILDSGEYKSYVGRIGSLRETWARQHWLFDHIEIDLLRIKVKMRSVDLVEPPQQIFRCPIHIVAARIVREIIPQGWTTKLLFEQVDLIEEQYYACPHKPSRVYNWVKQDQTFHHPILQVFISHVPYPTIKKIVPDYSPPKAPGRIRSEPRKIWWMWRSQNSVSIFSVHFAGHPHRTCFTYALVISAGRLGGESRTVYSAGP